MLHVMIGDEKVPVPREVVAEGGAAIQSFIDGQSARVAVERAPAPRRAPVKEA